MSVQNYEDYLDKQRFYTDRELKEMFDDDFKKNFGSSLIMKNYEDFERYSVDKLTKEEMISIVVDGEVRRISKFLIKDLIEDEGMYRYLLSNMDNELGIAAKIIFIDDDRYYCIRLYRVEVASCLRKLNQVYSNNNILNVKVNMRTGLIHSLVTEKSLIAKSYGANKLFEIGIDEKKVILPEEYLVRLLVIGNKKDFLRELEKDRYGYSKEIICYSIFQYVERNRILYKYSLSKKTLNFYERLKNYEIVDFESLNKNRVSNTYNSQESDTNILDTVEIPGCIVELLNDFPHKNYSPLEISLYLYIELSCAYSVYLEETGVKDESSVNNFILIYAKILSSLGINFTISQNVIANVALDNNKLTFSSGEFMCSIDSRKKNNLDDIMCNKINGEFLALTSTNSALVSKIKFKELSNKIYADYIDDKRKEIELENRITEYKDQFSVNSIDKTKRLRIFLQAIARKDLKGLDNIKYIQRIFHNIFGYNKNISLCFLMSSKNKHIGFTPITIVVIEGKPTKYLMIDNRAEPSLREVSESDIIKLLDQGYYFDPTDSGFEFKVGDRYVRYN